MPKYFLLSIHLPDFEPNFSLIFVHSEKIHNSSNNIRNVQGDHLVVQVVVYRIINV